MAGPGFYFLTLDYEQRSNNEAVRLSVADKGRLLGYKDGGVDVFDRTTTAIVGKISACIAESAICIKKC